MAFFRQTFIDGVTVVTAAWLNGIQEVVGASAVTVEYSDSLTYAVGDLTSYNNNLYVCTTPITTPEAWNASHWQQTSLQALLAEKADTFDTITNAQIDALFGS